MRRDIEELVERARRVATSGTGLGLLHLVGELREVVELMGQVRQLETELEAITTKGPQSVAQLDRARQRRDDARAALDKTLAHLGVRGQAALPGMEPLSMACETITLPGGFSAIVCSRGRAKKPKCKAKVGGKACGRAAPFACDHPTGEGKTCSRKLCAPHARIAGPDRHLCPEHAILAGMAPLYEESDLPELPGTLLASKYVSSCCLCGGRVEEGDRIHYHQKRVEHEACALRALAALGSV